MDEKAQPSLAPPSFVAAEQIEARIAAAEPLSMTQEEVETMAKGGSSKIVERLAAQGAAADVHTEKASPVAVTADDLAKIEKSGELPAKLRQRLEESARAPEESISSPVVTEKSAPTLSPQQRS